MKADITLLDGEEMNRLHPATFEIPPKSERENLKPGVYVKIGFSQGGFTERMWVIVQMRKDDGGYRGILNNDPAFLKGIKDTDPVEFEPRHVIGIYED